MLGAVGDLPVNLHRYAQGSPEITRYLVFRNRLRAHDDERARYEGHKRGLTGREWADMNLYADAKGPVVEEAIGRGRRPAPALTRRLSRRDAPPARRASARSPPGPRRHRSPRRRRRSP
ncbi:GrpB family protein [Pseudonocardia alni]|uniref:GrpB family protein n=1 Tax=Pseudonocardia alni TaxID=33907 RepID=UPI0015CAF922